MGRGEDGEFELILGNKQLLSVFFIVVVLLGVFFTMGYIVGKNSPSELVAGKQNPMVIDPSGQARKDPMGGLVVDPTRPGTPEVTAAAPTPAPTPAPEPSRAPSPKPTQAPTPAPPTPRPTPAPTPAPTPVAPVRTPSLTSAGEPAPGQSFLQVVASTRPDCEIIVDVLKRKGFSAVIAKGPSENLFRVLVGPLNDAAVISKTRSDLEAAGFQKPYLRKY